MKKKVEDIQIIMTDDGSHSIFNATLNETYHSTHGAIRESDHVFIKQGLLYKLTEALTSPLQILEIGLGTGLNTFLTALRAIKGPAIRYTTIEPYPLGSEIITQLNYPTFFQHDHGKDIFQTIHHSDWGVWKTVHQNFTLLKLRITLEELVPVPETYDLVYFDAFAPGKQQEVWQQHLLKKVFTGLVPTGILVTYCAQGQFKRDLASIGFNYETLPGPPGKKEMVRARKP